MFYRNMQAHFKLELNTGHQLLIKFAFLVMTKKGVNMQIS